MKVLISVLLFFIFVFAGAARVNALDQSDINPNNKFGVDILFPTEVGEAARIVNSSGGDWGYITIPIQASDKDLQKWQKFMDDCRKFHLIPIVRLATEGDYFDSSSWRKPELADVLDFANFLSSLTWPTKTHYIEVYNEVNHDNEWGGQANPKEYAQLLSYAVTVFKSKSDNFFIISAGLDNASVNSQTAMSEYTFFRQMNVAVPGIFNQIDGLGSHSYPNPAFSSPPTSDSVESISSFKYEAETVKLFSTKELPIFITETGWSRENLDENTIGQYYTDALNTVWNDQRIIAVTPFLLFAADKPFANFSILDTNLNDTPLAIALKKIPKVAGKPPLTPDVLAAETVKNENFPVVSFRKQSTNNFRLILQKAVKMVFPRLNMVK